MTEAGQRRPLFFLRRFFAVLGGLWGVSRTRIGIGFVLLLLGRLSIVAAPLCFGYLVAALSPEQDNGRALYLIIALAIGYAGLGALTHLADAVRHVVFHPVIERAVRELTLGALERIHAADAAYFRSRNTSLLTRAISRAAWSLDSLITIGLFNIMPTVLEILAIGILLVVFAGFEFALVLVLTVGGFIAWAARASRRQSCLYKARLDADNRVGRILGDSILNHDLVAVFSSRAQELRRLSESQDRLDRAWTRQERDLARSNIVQTLIVQCGFALMLLLGVIAVADGRMGVAAFIAVTLYAAQVFGPLNSIGLLYAGFRQSILDLDNLEQEVRVARAREEAGPTARAAFESGSLSLQGVTVIGDDGRKLLDRIDLILPRGHTIALVGETGGGKSTIARVVSGLLTPEEGDVIGPDGRLGAAELRSMTMLIPQHASLFDDSLEYNLLYGDPLASADDAQRITRIACLETFVDGLPHGLQSPMGELGVRVSGGERQRIAIARALLAARPVLILDEATADLDAITEARLVANLAAVPGGITKLVVAHRLDSIKDADQIHVVRNGRIVESGTHAELLARENAYRALWDARKGGG